MMGWKRKREDNKRGKVPRKEKGFIAGIGLYAAIGALILIAGLMIAVKLQSARLEAKTAQYDQLKAEVKVLGEQAKAEKVKTEAAQRKIFEEIVDGYEDELNSARAGAVAKFRMRYPTASSSTVSGATLRPPAVDGTGEKRLADCPREFVEDSAQDALTIRTWQDWAQGVKLPVE